MTTADPRSSLRLRQAEAADAEFAYHVRETAFRSYVEAAGGWDEGVQRQLHTERFARHETKVIQAGGIDVGVLVASRTDASLHVYQLFILPENQGRGLGSACMQLVIEEANAARMPITLRVLRVNPRALAFYRALGFGLEREDSTHLYLSLLPRG